MILTCDGYITMYAVMIYYTVGRVSILATDLQLLGCELHQNAFGGRAGPGPAGEL